MQRNGFTLIEILIVIAIIGILAIVVMISLNPEGRFADAQNSRRVQDVEAIGKAVLQYSLDKAGWPSAIPPLQNTASDSNGFNKTTGAPDCNYAAVGAGGNTAQNVAAGCMWADDLSLSSLLTGAGYLARVPQDSGTYLHYFIALTPDGNHVVVMSDDMNTNGPTTNKAGTTWYYSTQ